MKKIHLLLLVVIVLFISSVSGCHKKSNSTSVPIENRSTEAQPAEPKTLEQTGLTDNRFDELSKKLRPVFFDFDKAAIRTDQVVTLENDASILKQYPDVSLLLEGHCDERGTEEYNLALGERRARAVRDYLMDLGVEGQRIKTVSFGESRPFELGHNESAWQQNRRGNPVALKASNGEEAN